MSTTQVPVKKVSSAAKVMVVEDESIISLDIKNSLLRLGYTVSGVAVSGDAALRKIKNNPPDLVLMDIHIKGEMSGIEVSQQIKSDFQIPVIYLTANADNSTFQEAKTTDPYGYILKPFEEKELGIAIEVALNKHQKEREVAASERWYATAFQSLNEAVIATDPEGSVVFMNTFAELITGWKLAEALNQPVETVLMLQKQIQQFDDMSTAEVTRSILTAVLEDRTTASLPNNIQLITRPRTAISLSGVAAPSTAIPIEGNATAIIDFAGDVIGGLFVFRQMQTGPVSRSQTDSAAPPQLSQRQAQADASKDNNVPQADDLALIKAFTRAFTKGQSVLLSTANLVAESAANSTTLTAKSEGIIINVKKINNKLTAMVKRDSIYWEAIRYTLIEHSFFPVSQRTNGTQYYQYRAIPEQCQIYYTSAIALWEAWHGKMSDQIQRQSSWVQPSRDKIIVLRRGSWYRIQQLILSEGHLHINTVGGEVFLQLEDSLIWGIQAQYCAL
ncbi:MAG: response regulator [Leptolyngbya sp. SIO4C1]|nr:response regulator [Leptolyngbya sp. SIO4C1]